MGCRENMGDGKPAAGNQQVVVLVGQTPPPYTGQAVMIEFLLEGLKRHFHVEHIRMAYSDSVSEVGKFKAKKIIELFSLIYRTRRLLKRYPSAVLYYPPASPDWIPVIRDIIFLLCVRPLAKKTVYHYHAYGLSEFLTRHSFFRKTAAGAYGNADLAVVPTPSCKDETCLSSARRIEVVPYGVDISRPAGSNHEEESEVFRILFVGIHTEGKGIFELVETANRLTERHIPVEIHCVGSWANLEEKKRVEQLICRYGLQHVIKFCGCCTGDALWRKYLWADVLFFPTHYRFETQGMVVVEAMAFGLPVVASRWHGPQDIIEDRQTGVLCEPGSVEAYTAALTELFVSIDLRKRMGSAGRLRYETLYTGEIFIGKWVSLITELYESN